MDIKNINGTYIAEGITREDILNAEEYAQYKEILDNVIQEAKNVRGFGSDEIIQSQLNALKTAKDKLKYNSFLMIDFNNNILTLDDVNNVDIQGGGFVFERTFSRMKDIISRSKYKLVAVLVEETDPMGKVNNTLRLFRINFIRKCLNEYIKILNK